jgi:hypothetical protein
MTDELIQWLKEVWDKCPGALPQKREMFIQMVFGNM